MNKKNMIIGQSGGPTAVINSIVEVGTVGNGKQAVYDEQPQALPGDVSWLLQIQIKRFAGRI